MLSRKSLDHVWHVAEHRARGSIVSEFLQLHEVGVAYVFEVSAQAEVQVQVSFELSWEKLTGRAEVRVGTEVAANVAPNANVGGAREVQSRKGEAQEADTEQRAVLHDAAAASDPPAEGRAAGAPTPCAPNCDPQSRIGVPDVAMLFRTKR